MKNKTYNWQAQSRDSAKWQNGTIQARNKKIAHALLTAEWQNIKITVESQNHNAKMPLPAHQFSQLCYHLGNFLKSGIDLNKAFQLLQQSQKNKKLNQFTRALSDKLNQGSSLTIAMQELNASHNVFYLKLIEIGEHSGCLDKMLLKVHYYLKRHLNSVKQVQRALAYPLLVLTCALIVVVFMLFMIIPKFAELFTSFDAELPYLTRSLIKLADILQQHFALFGLICISLPIVFSLLYRNYKAFRIRIQTATLYSPLVGRLNRDIITARFCHSLATLLDAGLPINQSLKVLTHLSPIPQYQQAINTALKRIEQGANLSYAMQQKVWPLALQQIIHSGENSGNLDTLLFKLADEYDAEIQQKLDNINTLLEPLFMLILGTIIAIIVIAMYLPILQMGSVF